MSNTLSLTADFAIQAAAEGEARTPTFSIVAYTGDAIRQSWSRNPLVVDLAGMDTSRQEVPILLDHQPVVESVAGQSNAVRNDGQQLTLDGSLFGESSRVSTMLGLARKGLKMQASIGADVGRIENVAAGERVMVNGREFTGPISVVRSSRLREVSIVLFGADANTSAAIAAEANAGVSTMSDELDPTKAVEAGGQTDGVSTPAAVPAPVQVQAEATSLDVEAVATKVFEKIQAQKLAEVRASRPAISAPVADAGPGEAEVVKAGLALAGGLQAPEKHFDARTLEAADKRRNEWGVQQVILAAAKAGGYSGVQKITSGNISEVLRCAFGYGGPQVQATFSTHSISSILGATYGKFLLQGFNSVENVYEQISFARNVPDYKTVTGVRLNGGFDFEEVGSSGELKSADADQESRTNRARLFGRYSTLTMVDIVNDDLGALTAIPTRLGRGAKLKLNTDFWTEFELNNATYYQKASAAAGNALALSSLKTAVQNVRKLTDTDGKPLGMMPTILLVSPENEITAAELMSSSLLISGTNTATQGNANVLAGRFRVVSSAYLTSSSTWWLAFDPMDLPCMEIAYLNGQRTPVVQQAEADFNVLGVQFRGYFSYGVAKAESRGAYRMATA